MSGIRYLCRVFFKVASGMPLGAILIPLGSIFLNLVWISDELMMDFNDLFRCVVWMDCCRSDCFRSSKLRWILMRLRHFECAFGPRTASGTGLFQKTLARRSWPPFWLILDRAWFHFQWSLDGFLGGTNMPPKSPQAFRDILPFGFWFACVPSILLA